MINILIIEDDENVNRGIAFSLESLESKYSQP